MLLGKGIQRRCAAACYRVLEERLEACNWLGTPEDLSRILEGAKTEVLALRELAKRHGHGDRPVIWHPPHDGLFSPAAEGLF